MTNAHDLPEAIQWHEGMLLGPQHFQQQSLRNELLLHYHARLMAPYHWGVNHLKIDPMLLVDGQFRVLELEAVMPDGLVVTTVHHEIKDGTVDLEPWKDAATDEPVPVHIAVPARRSHGGAVQGELRRYDSVDGDVVHDENTGEGEMRLPRLRPRLTVMIGETPPEKYVSFPLAKVVYRDESFSLARYSPPVLRVTPTSPIGDLCSAMATRLREKAVLLADKARTPSVAARPPQLLETKSQIRALAAGLPEFEVLLASGTAHPFPLYLSLCRLIGGLASLGSGLIPPVLDTYEHDDPMRAFSQAYRFVDRVIAEGFIESFMAFPLAFDKGSFSVRFDPEWQKRRLIVGVRARTGAAAGDAARWLESSIIGSESKIPSMRQRRVLGVTRNPIEGEDDLVPTSGVSLFALRQDPDFIDSDEPLVVFNPNDPTGQSGPAEVVLYVRNPDRPQ